MPEHYSSPDARADAIRELEDKEEAHKYDTREPKGADREKFMQKMSDRIAELEAALAGSDLSAKVRADHEGQLAILKDSRKSFEAGEPIKGPF